MSPKEDSDRSLFARISESWKFSHWVAAITVGLLWVVAAYELVTYLLDS